MQINPNHRLVVDGIDYEVEVGHDGDVIWIYDSEGNLIADGENDEGCESFVFTNNSQTGVQKDLYEKGWRDQATWLISTQEG